MDEHHSIDISDKPELARLADEVAESGKPCVLRRGDREVAVLMPRRQRSRPRPRRLVDTSGLPSVAHVTLDDVVGAAGVLDVPMDWAELRQIAREDALLHKHDAAS